MRDSEQCRRSGAESTTPHLATGSACGSDKPASAVGKSSLPVGTSDAMFADACPISEAGASDYNHILNAHKVLSVKPHVLPIRTIEYEGTAS